MKCLLKCLLECLLECLLKCTPRLAGPSFILATLIFANLIFPGTGFGAQIIGIEKGRVDDVPADSGYTFMDRVEEAVEPLRSLEYTAGFGFGNSGFQGALTVGYVMGPYVVIDTTGFYARESDDARGHNLRSGMSTDLTLRFGRRSGVLVPFVGSGVGFERWDQTLSEGVDLPISKRDDNATVSQFAGIAFRLTPSTQLKMTSRWLTWLDNPPLDLATRFESRLARRERRMDVAVGVVF